MYRGARTENVSGEIFTLLRGYESIPGNEYALVLYVISENADHVQDLYVNGQKVEGSIYSQFFTLEKGTPYEFLPECPAKIDELNLVQPHGISIKFKGGESNATYYVALQRLRFIDAYKNKEEEMVYKMLDTDKEDGIKTYKITGKVEMFVRQNFNLPKRLVWFQYNEKKGYLPCRR